MALQLPEPCLCLVTDRSLGDANSLVQRVAEAVAGGVDLVQVREKDLPGGHLVELTTTIREATGSAALVIVNERADVAAAADADGVQLGEEAIPVAAARSVVGTGRFIGRSVHSVDGGVQAAAQGADFLVVGTMFASRTHPGETPTGPGLLHRLSQLCSLPLIGIGGIDVRNVAEVMQAGAQGAAVISSILSAPDPREAARSLKEVMLATYRTSRPVTGGANPA
jgi:thiamine-phosphate diphosphorylase